MNDKLQTETVKIKPNHIYKCIRENINLTRRQVWKDGDGHYHCSQCNEYVDDVTDTETGQEILRWL